MPRLIPLLRLFTASVIVAVCLPICAAEFFVATEGNDLDPGTRERPLATLAAARDAVRRYKRAHQAGDITVYLHGGTYFLRETVVFGLEDSGSDAQQITYAASPGETPVLSGSVPVPKWEKLNRSPPELPEAARGKVWVADVSLVRELKQKQTPSPSLAEQEKRGGPFLTLFAGGRRLPRARGPGFSPARKLERNSADRQTIYFPGLSLRNWPGLADAEVLIIPANFWTSNILPLASVDEKSHTARTAFPGTYPLGANGMQSNTAWAENALELLGTPGQWVLDSAAARLYYWPESGRPADDLRVPVLTELVRVEGRIDDAGPRDEPVRKLAFRGLTFTHADRYAWHGQTGWGLQHDWERFDSPSAMLRLRGAESCTVEDCHFVNAGSSGLRVDLHGQNHRIVGNRFEHLGGVGILLAGYGPGTKDVNLRNEVINNYIHHTGELYWGSPAIFAWQSGSNRIAHNYIHHIPYTGICVTGRIVWSRNSVAECSRTIRWNEVRIQPGRGGLPSWHQREPYLHSRRNLVERNEIHNAMEVTGDGNCIYVSGAGVGNVVRENYCHDCFGRYMNAVIRCDDDQHETLIERNLLTRTRGNGEGIISKGKNDILGNIIADLRPEANHRGYLAFPYASPRGSRIEGNVFYACGPGQIACGEGAGRGKEPPALLGDTLADRNVYFSTADPDWGQRHLEEQRPRGIETHSLAADPQFVDPARDDFRFRPGSPALALGIRQPISAADAGLESAYQRRFLGERIRTAIVPSSGLLAHPLSVTITASPPNAEIHYTLDGTEPDEQSTRYTAPLMLDRPIMVRARSFAPGSLDPAGAAADFFGPPEPLVEDFEDSRPGDLAPHAETVEEGGSTVRVCDDQAASGKHSLRFIDAPGLKQQFKPMISYRAQLDSGKLLCRFDLRVDRLTMFTCQWRQYQGSRYDRGPMLQVSEGGKVVVNGQPLATIPLGTWVAFEMSCFLGRKADGKFDLTVTVPDEPTPRHFPGLHYDRRFRRLTWLGFTAPGQSRSTFYLDNVSLRARLDNP